MKTLDVYYHNHIIGQLIQNQHGDMNFTYSSDWLNNENAIAISQSLPLREETYERKECTAFFNGILPEANQRKLIARHLGISAGNDYSLLEKIGGECAGALTLIPSSTTLNPNNYSYNKLTDSMLAKTLNELPTRPLLAGNQNIRLSLAGVQDKLAVLVKDKEIHIPLNNAPSSHLLKPDFNALEGVIFNEAFCMQLAKAIGLDVADVSLHQTENIDYLLIKRYDRIQKEKSIERLHQEDFCQALNIISSKKYQNEGGPSLKQSFDLIRQATSRPAIEINKMLDAVIFNFFIGNCDAHGKNFSLLYDRGIQLSPLYDLVSTIYYPNLDNRMAMKIGGEYKIDRIKLQHFDKLAEEAALAKPGVRKHVLEVAKNILTTLPTLTPTNTVQKELALLIKNRCASFIENNWQ